AADEECDQRRRDAHVERPRLPAQLLGPATGPCSRQGCSERRDEHDSRDDRRRRRAQQPVIEHVAPRRSREARAAGIRDPDHHQDFSQAQQNPAIIPILAHPALWKGERGSAWLAATASAAARRITAGTATNCRVRRSKGFQRRSGVIISLIRLKLSWFPDIGCPVYPMDDSRPSV